MEGPVRAYETLCVRGPAAGTLTHLARNEKQVQAGKHKWISGNQDTSMQDISGSGNQVGLPRLTRTNLIS